MPSSPAPELDLATIHRALAGDPPAVARLYATHHPLVLRTAQRTLERLRLSEAPCELAGEVWLRLLDHGCRPLRAFDPARGSFHAFMKMVSWQQAYDVARRWQRRARHEDPSPWTEVLEPLAPCATTVLHHRRLVCRMLAARPLCAIDLALLEEVLLWQTPVCELAPRIGRSAHTLQRRKERLRKRLRTAACSLDDELARAAA